jgi:hypothetical protein
MRARPLRVLGNVVVTLSVAFASLAAATARAASYRVVDLTPPGLVAPYGAGFRAADDDVGIGNIQVGLNVDTRAFLWNFRDGGRLSLHPASGYRSTTAQGGNALQQAGWATAAAGGGLRAVLWHGTPGSIVDMHPDGATGSWMSDADGVRQVGTVTSSTDLGRPALWSGAPNAWLDLTPAGFTGGQVAALDGARQGGWVIRGEDWHAALWQGSAQSFIDLHPAASPHRSSAVIEVNGDQQVGWAGTGLLGTARAMLWHGTADSAVDLHPEEFIYSQAGATNGVQQAGFASTTNNLFLLQEACAFVWTGTAESGINLHQYLPEGYLRSEATGIDSAGNVYGVAIDAAGVPHAARWVPIPEPTSATLLIVCATGFLARRRPMTSPRHSS